MHGAPTCRLLICYAAVRTSASEPGRGTPTSTYRLQLGPELKFADAADAGSYLADLGVTHAYLSPILGARQGSTHGYDVVDHSRSTATWWGEGFAALRKALAAAGIGIVVDVVPNHMAIPVPEYLNKALWSVLCEGAAVTVCAAGSTSTGTPRAAAS